MPIETRIPHVQWAIEGDVKSAAGDTEGAIVSYRKVLESTEFFLNPNFNFSVFRIPINYKLARLEEQSGKLAEARKHYRAYLDCWGEADMNIPNAGDARVRLQALEKN